MRKSVLLTAAAVWAVTIGAQAHAGVAGDFVKSGSQCYKDPVYWDGPAGIPAQIATLCRFWVPARFLQNANNIYAITLADTSECRDPFLYNNNYTGAPVYASFMYHPKDNSLWYSAAYDLNLGPFPKYLGIRDEGIYSETRYGYMPQLSSSEVDRWWPRYVSVYIYYRLFNFSYPSTRSYINGDIAPTAPVDPQCIKSVELWNGG